MNSLIHSEEYSKKLEEDGVIKIPFLTQDELNTINTFYQEFHSEGIPPTWYNGIHMTIWHHDLNYKLQIQKKLEELTKAAAERTFKNFRAISQQFIVKMNGTETTFPIHQDWSIVDEDKYLSLNLWIPLHDVDEKNGAMWIVKGSHRIDRKVRGAGYLFPNYHPVMEDIKPRMTSYPMKAGEALVFKHSTIHGSPHNQADKARVIVQISVIPKEAPLQIYFQKNAESPLEVHAPKDDFVFNYNKIREDSVEIPPTRNPIEIRSAFKVKTATFDEVMKAIEPNNRQKASSWMNVLKKLFTWN